MDRKTGFEGKTAVITGAGGILCSIFAKKLAAAGAKTALIGRHMESLETVARDITEKGGIAKCYQGDVLVRTDLERCREHILSELGPCDILINGAGGNKPSANTDKEYYETGDIEAELQSFFDISEAGFREVMDLNFLGTVLAVQVFAQDMLGRNGCNILNISSMNAFSPLTKIPAYSGAKAAVSNFTKWLAVHFCREGIRVNAIAPGFFSSRQNAALLWDENGNPTSRTEKILQATPMNRLGNPEELTGALMFLLDNEKASFITGVVLPVDGGFSAYSGV